MNDFELEQTDNEDNEAFQVTYPEGGFFVVQNWVNNWLESTTEVAVYEGLAKYADRAGSCYPSHQQLADHAKCSVSTVKRALDSMRDKKVLLRWNTGGIDPKTGKHLANTYYLFQTPRFRAKKSKTPGETVAHSEPRTQTQNTRSEPRVTLTVGHSELPTKPYKEGGANAPAQTEKRVSKREQLLDRIPQPKKNLEILMKKATNILAVENNKNWRWDISRAHHPEYETDLAELVDIWEKQNPDRPFAADGNFVDMELREGDYEYALREEQRAWRAKVAKV